jgi:hypothetical protein
MTGCAPIFDSKARKVHPARQQPLSPIRLFNGLKFNWPIWRTMPSWSMDQALCILHNTPVILQLKHKYRPLAGTVELHIGKVARDLFRSAVETGEISDPASPARWLALAERLGFAIPSELRAVSEPASLPQSERTERPGTASYSDIRSALQEIGQAPEAEHVEGVRAALPGRRVLRKQVRDARAEVFGKPRRGRPQTLE